MPNKLFSKKGVAILTIYGQNCGNRLQNYALQTVLKQMGCRVHTLRRVQSPLFRDMLRHWVKPLLEHNRYSRFLAFNRQIHWSRYIVSPKYVTQDLADAYDLFVIGSDQVWNPYYNADLSLVYLSMVPPEKKLAYAASFGIDSIPQEMHEPIAGMLNTVPRILVREESGADIVKELTGRDAEVVLDPTLLLTAGQWEQVMRKPRDFPKKPYCFVYLLGDSDPEGNIQAFCRERGLQNVDFFDDGRMAGPAEFLYLIRHADLICTDSYHACIFSFLMKKPLVIFDRISKDQDMSTRIDTLCRTFSLSAHRISSDSFCMEAVLSDSYETGHEVLNRERKRCTALLEQALEQRADAPV